MTGLVRKATLLGVCGLLAASSAYAFVPDPAHSTCLVIPVVTKVTSPSAPYAPYHSVNVTVRDVSNTPIANCRVWIDVSTCCDVVLCNVDGQTPTRTADALTNGSGVATFTVIGASKHTTGPSNFIYGTNSPPNACGASGAHVFANSGTGDVDLGGKTTVVLDLNGARAGLSGANSVDQAQAITSINAAILRVLYLGSLDISCAFSLGQPVGSQCGVMNSLDQSFEITATNASVLSGQVACGAYHDKNCGP